MTTQSTNEHLNNASKTAKETKGDMEHGVKNVGKEFADRGQQIYQDAHDYIEDKSEDLKERSTQAADTARSKIKAQPLAYVLGAAALGVLIGALWRRNAIRAA